MPIAVAEEAPAAVVVGRFNEKDGTLPRKWPNASGGERTDSLEANPTAGLS
jgi:hypothetical protein